MTVTPWRAHQKRRKQYAGVEFENPSHLGQQHAEPRRTKPTCRLRFASVNRLHYLFLVTGARTAQARHGHEHVLKPFGDLGIEREPALHQRFRRNLVDVGHHLLLQFVHHRCLHRLQIRSEEHTSELQSPDHLVCRLLLEKKNSYSEEIAKLGSMWKASWPGAHCRFDLVMLGTRLMLLICVQFR